MLGWKVSPEPLEPVEGSADKDASGQSQLCMRRDALQRACQIHEHSDTVLNAPSCNKHPGFATLLELHQRIRESCSEVLGFGHRDSPTVAHAFLGHDRAGHAERQASSEGGAGEVCLNLSRPHVSGR